MLDDFNNHQSHQNSYYLLGHVFCWFLFPCQFQNLYYYSWLLWPFLTILMISSLNLWTFSLCFLAVMFMATYECALTLSLAQCVNWFCLVMFYRYISMKYLMKSLRSWYVLFLVIDYFVDVSYTGTASGRNYLLSLSWVANVFLIFFFLFRLMRELLSMSLGDW